MLRVYRASNENIALIFTFLSFSVRESILSETIANVVSVIRSLYPALSCKHIYNFDINLTAGLCNYKLVKFKTGNGHK